MAGFRTLPIGVQRDARAEEGLVRVMLLVLDAVDCFNGRIRLFELERLVKPAPN